MIYEPNPKLNKILNTPSRYKVIYGGRGSSKSFSMCLHLIKLATSFKIKILCTRQFQNKISDSVYTLLVSQINDMGLSGGFNITKNSIINKHTGADFIFYGINRNISEMKSLEGVDLLYIEEGESLTKQQLDILAPTIRKEGSEIYIVFNPKHITDFIYERFVTSPRKNSINHFINYHENPHISQTLIDEANEEKDSDIDEYNHIWLGQPLTDDDLSFIKYSWILSAVDSHLVLGLEVSKGALNIKSLDIADTGKDMNASISRREFLIHNCDTWKGREDRMQYSVSRATKHADLFIFDSVGMGAGVGTMCRNIGYQNYNKFNAGAKVKYPTRFYKPKVTNKEMFSNLKAQTWQIVADKFLNTFKAINGLDYDEDNIISICSKLPHLNQLIKELHTPFKDEDLQLRRKVESKKDLAKRGVKSPNLADAFVMCFADVSFTYGGDSAIRHLPV